MVLPIASLFFIANFWGFPEKIELVIEHQVVPSDSFGEEDISVKILVSNKTAASLGNVEVNEYLPAEIKLESGAKRVLTQLAPDETVGVELEFDSPIRGHYSIGP